MFAKKYVMTLAYLSFPSSIIVEKGTGKHLWEVLAKYAVYRALETSAHLTITLRTVTSPDSQLGLRRKAVQTHPLPMTSHLGTNQVEDITVKIIHLLMKSTVIKQKECITRDAFIKPRAVIRRKLACHKNGTEGLRQRMVLVLPQRRIIPSPKKAEECH